MTKLNFLNKRNLSVIIKVVIAITGWFALILQLYILIDNTPANGLTPLQAIGRFFLFFTILTNLLVALSSTIVLVKHNSSLGKFFVKPSVVTAVTLYIFIVGLVYNIILRKLWQPTGLQQLADELLHVAVPILFIIYWIFFVEKGKLKWKDCLAWLLYPLVYLIYAMLRGNLEGFYPYPFLDINKLSYQRVILNCLGLTIVFIVLGLLLITVDKIFNSIKNPGKNIVKS
jgi:hypothetical protein